MFPIIRSIAHAKFFFFLQDLDGKSPSLMSIGSNDTANITYKSVKKKLRIGLVAILSFNVANIRMNLKHSDLLCIIALCLR